jgi:hypothetical protein
MQGFSF